MEILLFKTSIQKSDLERLSSLLNKISAIQKWTIDLDDCDRVLRIVGESIVLAEVKEKLNSADFHCLHMPVYELGVCWNKREE